jgi:hypothetical protein
MTQACATSTGSFPPQTEIPEDLLARPAKIPDVLRTVDPKTGKSTMTGEQCLVSLGGILDAAGSNAGQLRGLITAVRKQQAISEEKR